MTHRLSQRKNKSDGDLCKKALGEQVTQRVSAKYAERWTSYEKLAWHYYPKQFTVGGQQCREHGLDFASVLQVEEFTAEKYALMSVVTQEAGKVAPGLRPNTFVYALNLGRWGRPDRYSVTVANVEGKIMSCRPGDWDSVQRATGQLRK